MNKAEEQKLLAECHSQDLPLDHENWKRLEDYWNEEYLFDIFVKINDFEHKNKKAVKEQLKKFVSETVINEPEFVKDARIRYLKNQIIFYETKFLKTDNKKLLGKIKWMKTEIKNWENPGEYNPSEITDDDIRRAKEVDCENYVDVLRKDGDKAWAICPFHNDTSPSLCCYPGDRGFHCYSCKKSGDVIDLVKKIYNKNFIESIRLILNKN